MGSEGRVMKGEDLLSGNSPRGRGFTIQEIFIQGRESVMLINSSEELGDTAEKNPLRINEWKCK
jgi:hypothetical protein